SLPIFSDTKSRVEALHKVHGGRPDESGDKEVERMVITPFLVLVGPDSDMDMLLTRRVISSQLLPQYLPFQCLAIPMCQIRSSFVGALKKIHERLFGLA